LIIIAVLTLLNCRGTKGGDRIQKILTWGNLLVLATLIVMAAGKADIENVKPMFPNGLTGVGGAIAIIYVSFFGYQLIANTAEEIIDPEKTVPRAMLLSMIISLVFYVALAIISVLVVPWEKLAQSNAPLVDVALKGLGRRGWLLIAVGGVLASAAALNSTLLAQARQIFAMGKDGFLPALLGRIHAVNRTPQMALGAGGMVTAAALIFGDLTFIVKSALFAISESLLNRQSGELVVLNVVRATAQVDFYSALSHAEDSIHLLDGSTQLPSSNQVKIRPVVRVSRSLPKGIVHAAEEENCNLIVMGFAGEEASASIQLVEDVLNDARTDVILFKLRGEFAPKRIGVSLGGSGQLKPDCAVGRRPGGTLWRAYHVYEHAAGKLHGRTEGTLEQNPGGSDQTTRRQSPLPD